MKRVPIPVWLVTGYLGSGKTTLLQHWLRDPDLARAVLVINEIGEVSLDDRLLAGAVASASTISNACVCCTGLPDLENTLVDLWWDRLHRRRPAFDAVVIETTGLADPEPVIHALQRVPLLQERYALAGVITVVSATAGPGLITGIDEARAQVTHADGVIISKVDRAPAEALRRTIATLNPGARIAVSSMGSLTWSDTRSLVRRGEPGDGHAHDHGTAHARHHDHDHAHAHDTISRFIPLPDALARAALEALFDALDKGGLVRLKGVVRLDDGRLWALQWARGDGAAALSPFTGQSPPLGLTCIEHDR